MVDNLKVQLADKEKENGNMKEKIATLRKNNQLLLDQLNTRNPSRREI
jgi:cell division protein FtsB